jgi:two-component system OmpR family sensor kinase
VSEAAAGRVRPLVHELNLLFGRVRTAFDAQQNFVADAAHELRTPLAALKLQAQGLERAESAQARQLAVARLTAGIERATRLVEQLLVLARQEASAAGGYQGRWPTWRGVRRPGRRGPEQGSTGAAARRRGWVDGQPRR